MNFQKTARFIIFLSCVVAFLIAGRSLPSLVYGQRNSVRIGVLAYRGSDMAMKMWSETARYLSRRIPKHSFTVVPLTFKDIGSAVERGDIDFVVANTEIYVELESQY